jgi:hypothetical protein
VEARAEEDKVAVAKAAVGEVEVAAAKVVVKDPAEAADGRVLPATHREEDEETLLRSPNSIHLSGDLVGE